MVYPFDLARGTVWKEIPFGPPAAIIPGVGEITSREDVASFFRLAQAVRGFF
jgi:hypothetical protein